MKNKLLLTLFIASVLIISIISVSAFEFSLDGKSKEFTKTPKMKYGKVDIYDTGFLGLTKKELVESIELKNNTEKCSINCQAIKEITLYKKGVLIDNVKFLDKKGKIINVSYKIYVKKGTENIQVNDFGQKCYYKQEENGTMSKDCWREIVGSHNEQQDIWEEYKEGTEVKAGTYILKLEGYKNPLDTVDWIITSQGEEITEFAWWTASFDNDLIASYDFESITQLYDRQKLANGTVNQPGYTLTSLGHTDNGHKHTSENVGGGWSTFTDNIYPGGNGTISIWINVTKYEYCSGCEDEVTIFEEGTNNIQLTRSNHFVRHRCSGQALDTDVNMSNPSNLHRWMNIVATWNATGRTIYINGVKNASNTEICDMSAGSPLIGYVSASGGGSAVGANFTIDDFRIYNRSLTTLEVLFLYQQSEYSPPVVTLNSPEDYYNSSSSSVNFNCSVTVSGTALANISLVDNSTGAWVINQTTTIKGTSNSTTFTQSYSDKTFGWACRSCSNDTNCTYSTSNRTVTIDTIAPSISIYYPSGLINSGALGNNFSLNYTITELNKQSCWIEYNNINTTISCTQNSSFILASPTTLKIWANDSVGNTNYSTSTWQYKIFENTATFNSNAYETSRERYQLNITSESGTISLSSKLWYNGTDYTSEVSQTGTNYSLLNFLDIPFVTVESQNKSFFWEIIAYNGTGYYSINTTTKQQNVSAIHLSRCNATYTIQALNFTAIDEKLSTQVTPFKIDGTFNYWLGTGETYKNLSISENYENETTICISPAQKTFFINSNIEYGSFNDTYLTRDYSLSNYSISNLSENISLYLLEASSSTTFILKVQDSAQDAEPDIYIHIQRYFPGTDSYETVQIAKTDSTGKTVGFYQTETVTYRHRLYDENGTLLLQTSPGKVFAETVPYTITFTIGDAFDIPWIDLEDLDSLSSSIGYVTSTKIANFTYTDTSGSFSSARFYVEKVYLNQSNLMICNTTSALSSAAITCNLNNYNGSMIANGYITRGTTETMVELYSFEISDKGTVFDKTGLFLAWFILLVAGGVFIYNFIAGIWVEIAALFMVNLIGLAHFPGVFLWGALALAAIITVIFTRSDGGGY